MNNRIYEIQAEEVHKKDSPLGLENENKSLLFQPAKKREPIRIKKYVNEEIIVKESTKRCVIL